MVQGKGISVMDCFKASYDSFSDLISYLEDAAALFTLKDDSLDESVRDSIKQLRVEGLTSLEQAINLYARHSRVPPESPDASNAVIGIETALKSFGRVTDRLNIALADAYDALPPEAKNLVPFRQQFELMVERRPIYEEYLRQNIPRG